MNAVGDLQGGIEEASACLGYQVMQVKERPCQPKPPAS